MERDEREVRYGEHPSQRVRVLEPEQGPDGGRPRVAVLLHGGFWRDRHGRELMDPIAEDLLAAGWRVWNVEYRRTGGDGGGWPQTLEDVRAALVLLSEELSEHAPDEAADGPGRGRVGRPGRDRDAGRADRANVRRPGPVVAVGHSAGGHLALLAAPGSPLTGVVALAPVTDMVDTAERGLGEDAVAAFLGEEGPESAFHLSSPLRQVPIGVPQLVVHGDEDRRVPVEQSRTYVQEARLAGDEVDYEEVSGADHFVVIDPAHRAWASARAWMEAPQHP